MHAATALIRQIDTVHCIYLPDICSCFIFMSTFKHAVSQFHSSIVSVSAESVGGSTPGVRVTWNTTVPPECVTSARVEFRTASHGFAVATTSDHSDWSQVQYKLLHQGGSYWTPMCWALDMCKCLLEVKKWYGFTGNSISSARVTSTRKSKTQTREMQCIVGRAWGSCIVH